MRVFLNELALADAWTSVSSVKRPLKAILEARQEQPVLREALYCARGMGGVRTPSGMPLSRAAQQLPRDTRVQLFEWIAKYGPFIEDNRQFIDEDLFFFEEDDVTELGLGEAARRIRIKLHAATLSLAAHKHSRFAANPLRVVHGLPDEPIAHVDVANFTESEPLVDILRTLDPNPATWQDFLEDCRHRFDLLRIGPHCDETLAHLPYMPAAGRQIIQLLNILQSIRAEMDSGGSLSSTGLELRNRFFIGKRARFSDESERRKRQPQRFTFPDPEGGEDITCFWHGKVSTAAVRIHFDWPVQCGAKRLRVAYIGPHI